MYKASDKINKTSIVVFHTNDQDKCQNVQKFNQKGWVHVHEDFWGSCICQRRHPE